MSRSAVALRSSDLEALEDRLQRAFETGDPDGLEVIGYGEVSSVLAFESEGRRLAGKRLPPFPDAPSLGRYREAFHAYRARLTERGIELVPSELHVVGAADRPVAWCVQPVLPEGTLLPDVLRTASDEEARALFELLVERVMSTVDARTGLDAQLSNWVRVGGGLRYLDLTTPLLRDERGRELLDTELFLASIPSAVRWAVRRLMLRGILDKYYDRRGVVLDVLGNMHKERLGHLIPSCLDIANAAVEPAIDGEEVRRTYAGDARTWTLLQGLRRADRAWHLGILGRPYPFLLPGPIER